MTAYEMRISDWSSDVCSSDLLVLGLRREFRIGQLDRHDRGQSFTHVVAGERDLLFLQRARFFRIVVERAGQRGPEGGEMGAAVALRDVVGEAEHLLVVRSEEHTSELQSLMRSSYAVFCLTIKTRQT